MVKGGPSKTINTKVRNGKRMVGPLSRSFWEAGNKFWRVEMLLCFEVGQCRYPTHIQGDELRVVCVAMGAL